MVSVKKPLVFSLLTTFMGAPLRMPPWETSLWPVEPDRNGGGEAFVRLRGLGMPLRCFGEIPEVVK